MMLGSCFLGSCVNEKNIVNTSPPQNLVELERFGALHPGCQSWTNWRYLCRRNSSTGEQTCIDEPEFAVQPSAPFCVTGKDALEINAGFAESASRDRFCVDKTTIISHEIPSGRSLERPQCARYTKDRPFNGRNRNQKCKTSSYPARNKHSETIADFQFNPDGLAAHYPDC